MPHCKQMLSPRKLVEKVVSVTKQHATGCGQSDDIGKLSVLGELKNRSSLSNGLIGALVMA